ncbi:MAG: septum site-determining protein MinD [Candidatus Muiribacteriota bacterium]
MTDINSFLKSDVGYKTNPDLAKVIAVISGKGGVGKTTACANLALALAMSGLKIAVIDTDIGLRNLDIILGYSDRIYHNVIDVIDGTCSLSEALIPDKDVPNLVFLPASQIHEKGALKTKGFTRVIDALKPEYNYIFLDAPAGIGQGLKNLISVTDSAIVVVNPDKSSVLGADRVIGIFENHNIQVTDMIINRYNIESANKGDLLTIHKINEILGLNLLGVVPEDSSVTAALNSGIPLVKKQNTPAGKAFINISRRFLGKNVTLLYVFRDNFWSRMMGKIGF